MAYTIPTAADFKARFTRFAAVADATIDIYITEAANKVDDSWLEQDYATAILYLAAHLYVQESGTGADRPGVITSESFGPMSVSYAVGSQSNGGYQATEYGRRFAELAALNFPGVVTA